MTQDRRPRTTDLHSRTRPRSRSAGRYCWRRSLRLRHDRRVVEARPTPAPASASTVNPVTPTLTTTAVEPGVGLSPTIIGGLADLNGDGVVDGDDDSTAFYGDTEHHQRRARLRQLDGADERRNGRRWRHQRRRRLHAHRRRRHGRRRGRSVSWTARSQRRTVWRSGRDRSADRLQRGAIRTTRTSVTPTSPGRPSSERSIRTATRRSPEPTAHFEDHRRRRHPRKRPRAAVPGANADSARTTARST